MSAIHAIFCWMHIFEHAKNVNFIIFNETHPKYIKMDLQRILLIERNILGFVFVPLYTDYSFYLQRKFQVASAHDRDSKY